MSQVLASQSQYAASRTRVKRRAALHTLGCRLNQSETMILREKLIAQGFDIVDFGDEADLAIINTCTVTRLADSKCRQAIRGFIRRNPEAYTAVVGCYSQMGAKEIAGIEGVDLILGNHDKMNVLDYIGEAEKNPAPVIVRERIDRDDFTMHFAGETPFEWRANLKIQDGCDFMCSFCIIPFARGRARSREFGDLMAEARHQVARGVKELVLTGVNIGTYQHSDRSVLEVVDALSQLPGLERVRISSIEPTTIPVELFDRMNDPSHALMPYLHIPLQSGSDKVLTEMRRRYDIAEWEAFVNDAAARVPGICIGTDIMVGFPGETENDFAESCRVLTENPLAYGHVFTYSERGNTPAARRDDHVPMEERHQRSARLRRLSSERRYAFYESNLGRETEVLFEDPRENTASGLTDNYVRVVLSGDGLSGRTAAELRNEFARVRLERVSADFVEGKLIG
ncbi:tRNA (N(6)-L-threonylcarbamoyladenosine(37)-C(2))-methylthiotransferase MtaB [Cerasicoccus frondis]|uniref:tRNA (N(6)-L-threonylcarbamoyladenosine(37)-C(2))- methylthiotransferase MtaB n=1 Tax=Cerasicoccus frondis TaxID=490090 RepID=UPI0028529055|nr:tRNA (N(6)-L-threonylcarbamoyladenosine(37)-C(2))-methylthiotransferase MtaB [Cerasicoccus frondis]